ncbi:hypothetical protein DYB35_006959 [Aphanomyces astaci]|uniref:Large ribosomal subunit protein bL32m n=1 Tax=Aphanomyces astaci TaxID=112090 RepID=A0A3R7B1D7_APHAT|nr:hypothetical protein DYB35_006959 [Aphanomyces astaci]
MRSPPPPRSRSLLQQQDKDQGDGTAVSDSDSDDEADSDKETTYSTLLQALNAHAEDAEAELKQDNTLEGDELEAVVEFKDRILELKTKVQMIEDGKFAEYCRRCADFKDDRSRSLETAKQHKELQLKNVEDLRLCDLQTADNVYATAKSHVKKRLVDKVTSMLTDVDAKLKQLDIMEAEASSSAPVKKGPIEVPSVGSEQIEDDDDQPRPKKVKLMAFDSVNMSGPLATKIKTQVPGYKDLPYENLTALSTDDINADLHAVCAVWKAAVPEPPSSPQARNPLSLETVAIHYNRGLLWCGKYIFDEGDEVVVSSKVMKREYIGVIHALSNDAVFLRLNTGETARVHYSLIASMRCELKPILRGNAGLKNLQMALVRLVSSVRRMLQTPQWSFLPQVQLELLPGVHLPEVDADEVDDDALWHACPKSKVTRSRKRIRNNDPSKRLKNIVHLQDCEHCGNKKLRHRLCMGCFKKGEYFTA